MFDGAAVTFSTPMEARRHGIETIYQDLALANNLDVGANIFLGREVKKRWFGGLVHTLDDKEMEGQSRKTLELRCRSASPRSASRSRRCRAGSARRWRSRAPSIGTPS